VRDRIGRVTVQIIMVERPITIVETTYPSQFRHRFVPNKTVSVRAIGLATNLDKSFIVSKGTMMDALLMSYHKEFWVRRETVTGVGGTASRDTVHGANGLLVAMGDGTKLTSRSAEFHGAEEIVLVRLNEFKTKAFARSDYRK
jgi:hypothetical protein